MDALLTTAESGAVLSMLNPNFSLVVPPNARAKIPLTIAVHPALPSGERFVNLWLERRTEDGLLDDLYARWILGEQAKKKERRWSIVQDVLGWLE